VHAVCSSGCFPWLVEVLRSLQSSSSQAVSACAEEGVLILINVLLRNALPQMCSVCMYIATSCALLAGLDPQVAEQPISSVPFLHVFCSEGPHLTLVLMAF
jgi:hypothetical protein